MLRRRPTHMRISLGTMIPYEKIKEDNYDLPPLLSDILTL